MHLGGIIKQYIWVYLRIKSSAIVSKLIQFLRGKGRAGAIIRWVLHDELVQLSQYR